MMLEILNDMAFGSLKFIHPLTGTVDIYCKKRKILNKEMFSKMLIPQNPSSNENHGRG